MKDGHLTLLIVPEDEHKVRQIRVSYRALRWLGGLAGVLAVAFLVGLALYGSVIGRAGRVALLERENRRLLAESAKVGRLAENLERSERTYQKIRSLAGLEDLPAIATAADGPAEEAPDPMPGEEGPHLPGAEQPDPLREAERPDPRRAEGPRRAGWPLAVKGFVTARFAGPGGHTGVDIAVPRETPVLATAPGRVSEAGFDSIFGHYVVVAHEAGLETMYGHNARLLVAEGQRVDRAEAIAFSGNSGRSTAPHLHYEVREAGRAVDPDPYLHGDRRSP